MASVFIVLMMADVVDDLGGVRQQFAEPGAGLPVLLELEDGAAPPGNVLWPEVMPVMRWPMRTLPGSSVPDSLSSVGL